MKPSHTKEALGAERREDGRQKRGLHMSDL